MRFLFKISHTHISFWILSQLVSSFWGWHFFGFCFFYQRSWWTEWQDYLWFIASNCWWLHVWSLLSVYIVLYTPKGYYGISFIIGSSAHPRFWHVDIFVHLLPLDSSWMLPASLLFDICLCSEILLWATLCPSLLLALAEYFLLSFLTTLAKISSLCFSFSHSLQNNLNSFEVCQYLVIEHLPSGEYADFMNIFKTANVFLLKYKLWLAFHVQEVSLDRTLNMEYPPVHYFWASWLPIQSCISWPAVICLLSFYILSATGSDCLFQSIVFP